MRKRIEKLARHAAPCPIRLPEAIRGGEPRITLYSDSQVFIENHAGIIEFDDGHIKVAARRSAFAIRGRRLTIERCECGALTVRGLILSIEACPSGGEP